MSIAGTSRIMAFPRKMVETIVLGLSNPLNRHLVKLVSFDFPPELHQHFRREVKDWLNELQALRFKPYNRTGTFNFYFDLLCDYPFGGVELENMQSIIDLTADEYDRIPIRSAQQMIEWVADLPHRTGRAAA